MTEYMTGIVDGRLIWAAGEITRNWLDERYRFAEFARPRWMEWGGEELVNHMMTKYIHNDEKSIVEYMYNLDSRNKKLVLLYLLWKVEDYDPTLWTIDITE